MRMKVLAGLSLASLLCAQSLPEMRMLPAEMRGGAVDGNQIGSSGLAGVHTKVLFGDPSKAGFYSILLFVPAHTTIQGHSHRDDRMATVVSGTWLLRLWRFISTFSCSSSSSFAGFRH